MVWRHLPIDGHQFALPAARAAICAARFGRFEAMNNGLFLRQDSLGLLSWSQYALRAGISDTATFAACISGRESQARLDTDRVAAGSIHAIGTPTILINGLEYVGVPDDLGRIVRYARHKAS